MPRTRLPGPRDNRTDLPLVGDKPPVPPITGLPYGQNGPANAMAAQATAALPQAGAGPGPTAPPPPGPVDPLAAAVPAAQATPFAPVGLFAPTARPDEAMTAGLPIGPGPGPEVLGQAAPPASSTMANVAAATGDAVLRTLAARAAARGQ